MKLLLPGSGWITVETIALYRESDVEEIANLRAQATQALSGSGMSLGVLGSPSLTLAAETAAIGMISGLMRNAAAKKGVEALQRANNKLNDMLRSGGSSHPVSSIKGVDLPDPSFWSVDGMLHRHIHSGMDFIRVESDMGTMDVQWRAIAAWLR